MTLHILAKNPWYYEDRKRFLKAEKQVFEISILHHKILLEFQIVFHFQNIKIQS
jgi:hypothetical protein